MEDNQDPQLPKGYSAVVDAPAPALPAGFSAVDDDVKKKDSSGIDSASGSSPSDTGLNGSQSSQNDPTIPPSKQKRPFLDFNKINKTNFNPQVKDVSGAVIDATKTVPVKARERKAVGQVVSLANDNEIKNYNKFDAERLQTINENIGVNKFADFIDTQDTPNAKTIAADIRTNSKSWSELPVEARQQMRDYATDQARVEAQQVIDKNNAQLKIEKARLSTLESSGYYDSSHVEDQISQTKAIHDKIDQLNNNNAIQKSKPGLMTVKVFKNDNDLLQGLGPQSEQYLSKVRADDPVAYDRLVRSVYDGSLDVDQKNEIIKGSLDIKRQEIETNFNALKNSGSIDRVQEYHGLQQKFTAATKNADDYAAQIGLTKGSPTEEEKAHYNILKAKAQRFAGRMIDYQNQGITDEISAVGDLNKNMKTQSDMVASSSLKYDLFHDEDKQKEVNDFVEQHPVVGRIWEGVKAVAGAVPGIAKSGAVVGEQIYEKGKALLGADTDTDAYNSLSGRFSAADFFDSLIPKRANLNLLDNNDDIVYKNLPNKAAETLSDMAGLLIGGNGSSLAFKAVGAGEELASAAGLMVSSYGQSRPDYFKHAIENGMSASDANKFADASAILTSSLELISPNKLLFGEEAKTEFSQEFAKYFAKDGWKMAFERSSERLFKEIIPENIQELSQSIGDKAVEFAANKVYNKDIFDANLSYAEVKETVILTSLATGLLTGVRNGSLNNEERQNYLFQSAKDLDTFQTALDNVPINNQDKARVSEQVYAYNKAINSIPSGVPDEIQQHVAPLLVAKQRLVNEIAGPVDEAFKKSARDKIAVIDNTVIGLTDGRYDPNHVVVTDDPALASRENTEPSIQARAQAILDNPVAAAQADISPVTENAPTSQSIAEETASAINENKPSPTVQVAAPVAVRDEVKSSLDKVSEEKSTPIFEVTPDSFTHLTNSVEAIADIVNSGVFLGKGEDLANFNKEVSTKRFNIDHENGGAPYFQKGGFAGEPRQKYLIVAKGEENFTPNINRTNASDFEQSQGIGVLNPEARDKSNLEVYVRNDEDGKYYQANIDDLVGSSHVTIQSEAVPAAPVESAPVVQNDSVRDFSVPTQDYGNVDLSEKKDGTFDVKFDDGSVENYTKEAVKETFGIDTNANTDNESDYRLSSESDPTTVAKLYDDKVKELQDTGSKESAIAQYGPSSNLEEFANNNDRNNITPDITKAYFNESNGIPLDTQAQEINDQFFNGQDVVSPGDIADFMVSYPKGAESFSTPSGNEDLRKISERYKELTGKNLTSNTAERLAEKYNATQEEVKQAEKFSQSQDQRIDDFIDNELGLTEGFIEPDVAVDNLLSEFDKYLADPANDYNLYFPIFNGLIPSEEAINNTKSIINERRTGQAESESNGNGSTDGNNVSEQSGTPGAENSEGETGRGEQTSDPLDFLNDADYNDPITEDTILEGDAAKALADRIKSLKINTGGTLMSNPLGIPLFIYNTSLDLIAKGIQQNNSVAISIGKGVTYVIDELKKLGGKFNFTEEEITKAFTDDLTKMGVINNNRKAELAAILQKATAKQATSFIRRGINTAEDFAKAIGKTLTPELSAAFDIAQQAVKTNPTNPRAEVDNLVSTPSPLVPSNVQTPPINPGETKAEYAKRLVEFRKNQQATTPGPSNINELNDLKREMRSRFEAFEQGNKAGQNTASQTQADIDKQLDGLRQRVLDVVAKIKSDGLLRSTGTGRQKILSIIQKVSQAGNNPNALYKAIDYATKAIEHLNYEKNIADAQSLRSIIAKMYFMTNQKSVSDFRNLDPTAVPSDMLDKYMDMLNDLKDSNISDWPEFKKDAKAIIDAAFVPQITQAPTGLNPYLAVPDFTKENKTWRETLKDTMSKFRRTWLDYKKGLPKELYDLQERAQGIVDREANRAIVNATALDKLITKDKTVKAADVDAALRGDQDAMNRLPVPIADAVTTMRSHVDALSATLIRAGLITPAQMANVEVHLGEYLTRSYRLYNDKNWTMENLPGPVYTKAAEFLFKQMYPLYKSEMTNATEDEISHATSEAVKARINEYFSKTENEYFQAGKIGSKDLSLFDHRKNVPEQIRALFGEVTDPLTNYSHTVFKIANLAANANFLNNLKDNYSGIYFFNENDPNRTANHSVKIAAEGSETMSPLNGMYTTPELAEAFNKIEDKTSDFVKKYMSFIGAVKAGKTVFSVVTHIKNIEGNVGFVLANGHFNFKEFGKAIAAVHDDIRHLDTDRLKEIIQPLIALGVIKQSVGANEIREMFNPDGLMASTFMNTFGEERKGFDKVKRFGNQALKWTTDMYEAEDNVFKVFAYLNDIKRYSNAMYGPGVNALVAPGESNALTPQQKADLDAKVAELIKNTYPTFSRVPDIARLASKYVPVGGNFIGFAAESYRVQKNLYLQMVSELRDPNPEIKKIGAQRLAGLGIYAGLKIALIKYVGAAGIAGLTGLLGADDDDEKRLHQASRRFLAPWSKNSDNIIKRTGDGKFTYIDFSSQDPFGNSSSVLNAFANGETPTEKAIGAAAEFFGPFTDQELTFKAVSNLYENKDDRGSEIYNESDDAYHKGMNIAGYFAKQLQPGTTASIQRAIEKGPATLNPVYRETEVDVTQQFGFMQRDNKKKLESIANIYNKAFYKEKDRDNVASAYDRAVGFAADQVLEMHKDYTAALELGASSRDLKEALKKQRLDGEIIRMITTGNIRDRDLIKKKKEPRE